MEAYIIIYTIMFLFFLMYGNIIFLHSINYWRYVSAIIIVFTLIEGSRYLRGIDYHHYGIYYSHPEYKGLEEDIGFEFLNNILRLFSHNEYFAFLMYALITIVSLCIFIKPFKELYGIIFIHMLIFIIHPSEWIIRQFISISIVYASFGLYFEKKIKLFCIMSLVGCSIHYSSLLLLLSFVMINTYKRPIPLKISLPAIVLIMCVFSVDAIVDNLFSVLEKTNLSFFQDYSYFVYMTRSDEFLTSDSSGLVTGNRSLITTVLNLLFYISVFFEGYKLLNKSEDKKYVIIYNMFVIGSLLYELFLKYELYSRLFRPLELVGFVVTAYIINRRQQCNYKLTWLYVIIFLFMNAVSFIYFPKDNYYKFIWDK